MPGVDDPERYQELIGAESNLAMMKIVSAANPAPVQTYPSEDAAKQSLGGTVPPNRRVLPYADAIVIPPKRRPILRTKPKQFVVVEYPAVVDGS
jgi:hypothetical protein